MACPRPSPVTCGGIRFQAAQRERAAIKPPSEPALSPCPQRPLEERRDKLSRLIHGVGNVLFSEALSAEGSLVFAKACELGVWRGSCRSAQAADIGAGRAAAGSSRRTRPVCGGDTSASRHRLTFARRVPFGRHAHRMPAPWSSWELSPRRPAGAVWGRHRPARSARSPVVMRTSSGLLETVRRAVYGSG